MVENVYGENHGDLVHRRAAAGGSDPARGEEKGPQAAEHARAVLEVLCQAVSQGEIEDIKAQLPKDFAELFEGTRH
jgi:uncharacterized protein (DUF2267 family)